MKAIDRSGKVQGRLSILRPGTSGKGGLFWIVKCACGSAEFEISSGRLGPKSGTKSCGCLQLEALARTNIGRGTHRSVGTLTHNSWHSMMLRCFNPNSKDYKTYRSRAPQERWKCFENFREDMGERPGVEYTLERVDNDLPYSKENCVWGTKTQQGRNTRTNRVLTFNDQTQCLSAWAEQVGIRHDTLSRRLEAGWAVDRVLTTKLRGTQ